ncbi:MAG TPA: spore coat U domain-containing protein [Burkholderiales bacterium]|nr:spore coat U domain-containing protein [Burkholderiales bacterium]
MFKKIAIASAAAALFGIGQCASAGQTTNTMNVTATVNANCSVTTAPSDYTGTYDPVSANATTPAGDLLFTQAIIFKCTKNSAGVTVGINPGLHNSSGRRLADTGAVNFLNYELYQPSGVGGAATCPNTQVYSQAGVGLFAVGSANFATGGTNVTVNICGKVPGAQDVPATGAYTDAVVVNVNY